MLIILATFTIPIIFTIRFGDGEKNVKETGGTVENIGNNELDEEKKENFAQNGASLMGENYEYKRYGTVKVLHTKDNSIEEMKTICKCGRKAILNGRKINGEFVFEGEQVAIDNIDNVQYESLCGHCYFRHKNNK